VSLRQTEITPDQFTSEHCTCGAPIVEDARFCYRCGRPLNEPASETVAETPVEATPPPLPDMRAAAAARLQQLPVSFSNPIAIRVAFVMSLGVMLLTLIPFVGVLSPLWWLGAGLNAVLLYRRLTGVSLSVRAGARLGSITGVLAFVSLLVIFALNVALSGKELFQEIAKQNPDITKALNNTPAMVFGVAVFVILFFGVVVGMCAAGGALGARFANRNAKV